MLKLILLSSIQALLLAAAQIFLKLSLVNLSVFSFSRKYFGELLINWKFATSGLLFIGASILWLHIIKHFPLSVAYPLVSLSYVFAMLAAVFIFQETVPLVRWIGVTLIILGVFLMIKQ